MDLDPAPDPEDPDQRIPAPAPDLPPTGVAAPGPAGGEGAGAWSLAPGAPLFTRPFVGLLMMQAAYGFSFSLFFLLPKYLATLGEPPARIGFVMGGFGVACIATIPFLPALIARLGRTGALTAAAALLSAAGAIFAVLPHPGLMAIPLRASEGITWTIMFSTAVALTAEMAPADRLAQAIGLAGAASLIMNAIAPAVGEPLADRFGFRPVFLLASLAALAAALLARRIPVTDRHSGRGALDPGTPPVAGARALPDRAGAPGRLAIYVVFAASGLGFSALFTFLAPFALAHGVKAIRAFFIAYTASALAVRVLGGRLSDRVGHRRIARWAVMLYGLVVASTGVLGPRHLALLGLIFGLAHGAAFPSLMALLVKMATPLRRPRILGVANGSMSLGVSSVYPAGLLISRWGYPAVFALAGGLVALSSLLLRGKERR